MENLSRDKQTEIDEMAKAVCYLDRTCDECMTSFECKAMMYAKRFYDAGYRKSTDVAEEIFAEIETSLHYKLINGEIHLIIREEDYNEYKKKYTKEK